LFINLPISKLLQVAAYRAVSYLS